MQTGLSGLSTKHKNNRLTLQYYTININNEVMTSFRSEEKLTFFSPTNFSQTTNNLVDSVKMKTNFQTGWVGRKQTIF